MHEFSNTSWAIMHACIFKYNLGYHKRAPMNIIHYPPTEQIPRARRSSNVVCSTDVNSEAEKPATPS